MSGDLTNSFKVPKGFCPTRFLAVLSVLAVSCNQPLSIKVSESIPPTFSFHASPFTHYKHLTFFIVIEVAPENEKLPAYSDTAVEDKTVWWIFPNEAAHGDYKNLPTITYGTVPTGWNQRVPARGGPPPLIEGKIYQAGGPQIEVPWAVMRFTIRHGKVVRLPFYEDEFEEKK
jgi:hypothetical protein